jgi:ABC-2 type transport system ATP-binding protein
LKDIGNLVIEGMIEVQGIKKSYFKKTVLDINELKINCGEIVGIVGNNGAGKTTLFRLMLDLICADKGNIWLDNILVSRSEDWKNFTGSYLDESFLIDFLTPEEFFSYIGNIYNFSRDDINTRLNSFIGLFNNEILGQEKKYIRDFSSGNKQKIGISSSLLINPKILILDEPFNHLDPSSQIQLKKILLDTNHILKTTLLISSHNLNHVSEICTRIIVLNKGKIVKDCDNEGRILEVLMSYF